MFATISHGLVLFELVGSNLCAPRCELVALQNSSLSMWTTIEATFRVENILASVKKYFLSTNFGLNCLILEIGFIWKILDEFGKYKIILEDCGLRNIDY